MRWGASALLAWAAVSWQSLPVLSEALPLYPEDPLEVTTQVAHSPGLPAHHSEYSDPCHVTTPPAVWHLSDIVNQALCHHPETRRTWALARDQTAQLGIAQSAYLPTLTLTTSISRSQNTAGSGFSNAVPLSSSVSSNGNQNEFTRIAPTLTLNYLLFDFGAREARVDTTLKALEAANWNHAAAIQTVLFQTVQAYYQVFATRAALDSSEASERSSEEALKAATFRHEVGSAPLADELQARTAYAQAKVNRQTALGNAQIALGVLANTMGLLPTTSLQVAMPTLDISDEKQKENVQTLIEEAKKWRPDFAATQAQVVAAEAGIVSAQSASLPTLSFVGNYTHSESMGFNGVSSWMVGIQVSAPLFTGFANTYQIKSAKEQVAIHTSSRDKLDQSIALEVWRAYFTLETSHETLRSTKELLASAIQAESVALGRYKAGAGTIVELLNAQATLANARFQQIQAHYNWRIGRAQLAQAIGQLISEEIIASAPRQ